MEQIHHVLSQMPATTESDRRNRAVLAFALLTGARDGAIASLKLKHLDLANQTVFQDAREVRTKFSKTFTTYFFPVGGNALDILTEWVTFLRTQLFYGNDDPLFPATLVSQGPEGEFESAGLVANHWCNATPIRAIFRVAFTAAGLPYFNPHSLRNTLMQFGLSRCRDGESLKAWSQNLGHERMLTSLTSYGTIPTERQGQIIQALATGKSEVAGLDDDSLNRLAQAIADKLPKAQR
jgi:integrase